MVNLTHEQSLLQEIDNLASQNQTTKIITFCKDVFQGTVGFVDNCYRLTCDDLQQSGVLPV